MKKLIILFLLLPVVTDAQNVTRIRVRNGGTGDSSLLANGVLYGAGTGAVKVTTAAGSDSLKILESRGNLAGPVWVTASSLGAVTVPITAPNGGTGIVSPPTWNIPIYRGSLAWDSVTAGTSGQVLTSGGAGAKAAWVTSVPLANGGTAGTTQASALKSVTPDSTANTGKVLGVIPGGGITWQSLNNLLIILSDTTGQTGKKLTVKAGGGFNWQ